jgi:hypothetical protein
MNSRLKRSLIVFALQLLIYGGLIVSYLFLILYFLKGWIVQINTRDRQLYAVLSLLLIVAQGMLLEALTSGLMHFFRSRLED